MRTIRSKRLAIAWLAVVAWAAVIFLMSSNTGEDLSDPGGFLGIVKQLLDQAQASLFGPGVDLVPSAAHFAEYAVLGLLLFRAIRLSGLRGTGSTKAGGSLSSAWPLLLAVSIASLYGMTDEIHQLFVPGRFCDPVDWMVDTAGALVGALGSRLCFRLKD